MGDKHLNYKDIVTLGKNHSLKIKLSPHSANKISQMREIIENKLEKGDQTIYGINTGFGYLSNTKIAPHKLEELQINLIRSHACGLGSSLNQDMIRSLMILRVQNFAYAHSGISLECVNFLLQMINEGIYPLIPKRGSVGASGDLAPLAHLALGMIGEGEVFYKGEISKAQNVFAHLKISPYKPLAKEGLSLINGTSFMATLAAYAVYDAEILFKTADIISAMSIDAMKASVAPFDERLNALRPIKGQQQVAQNIRKLFREKDEILESHKNCDRVQDPYSFRCIPQVHGACRQSLSFIIENINKELQTVSDNPVAFENGDVLSGGNFHGELLSMMMDYLAIASSEMSSMSERRIEKITNPNLSKLPAFVIEESGLNSGYMIPHVVAASLCSENKIYSHPASVDSIPTSADKEDHVSMGPTACHKVKKILTNLNHILAIELLTACQGIDLHSPLKPNKTLNIVYEKVREISPYMRKDRSLSEDIKKISKLILDAQIIDTIEDINKEPFE